MSKALVILFMSIVALPALHGETFGQVLSRDTISSVVDAELKKLRPETVSPDFSNWSVEAIQKCEAPNRDQATKLLVDRYHQFVLRIAQFADSLGIVVLSSSVGEEFLRLTVRCGPMPCNPKRCCKFCQEPCK